MALSPNRHIDAGTLLECMMEIQDEKVYSFFEYAQDEFFYEVASHFLFRGTFVSIVVPFIVLDIERSSGKEVLFREDSVTTKLIRPSFSVNNELFLFQSLSEGIADVLHLCAQKIDIQEIRKGEISKEVDMIINLTAKLISRICTFIRDCSAVWISLLRIITERIYDQFPGAEVKRTILSYFFFIRCMCPALLFPIKYNVPKRRNKKGNFLFFKETDLDHPNRINISIIVTKLLNAIGGGVLESKETWMGVFIPFVEIQSKKIALAFDYIMDQEKAALDFSRSKKFLLQNSALPLSTSAEKTMKKIICGKKSFDGLLYTSMRSMRDVSYSHPITWKRAEIHIWLRASGLEPFIPIFDAHNLYGTELLHVTRKRAGDELGLPTIGFQNCLLLAVKKLLYDYKNFIPNTKNSNLATVHSWGKRETVKWLQEIGCPELVESICIAKLYGKSFFTLTSDSLCTMGAPVAKIKKIICEARTLEAAMHRDQLATYYNTLHQEEIVPWNVNIADRYSVAFLRQLNVIRYTSSLQINHNELNGNSTDILPKEHHLLTIEQFTLGAVALYKQNNWKTIWFVIDNNIGVLRTYKKDAISPEFSKSQLVSVKARERIDLYQCAISASTCTPDRPYCFSIHTPTTLYTFDCFSEESAASWLHYIKLHTISYFPRFSIEIYSCPILICTAQTEKVIRFNRCTEAFSPFPLIGTSARNYFIGSPPLYSILGVETKVLFCGNEATLLCERFLEGNMECFLVVVTLKQEYELLNKGPSKNSLRKLKMSMERRSKSVPAVKGTAVGFLSLG